MAPTPMRVSGGAESARQNVSGAAQMNVGYPKSATPDVSRTADGDST
jgi:hypothetical protein